MTIEEQAQLIIDTWGKEMAIAKMKALIFNTEVSFDKMGYTPQDLRNVKEWKQVLKAIETLTQEPK